MSRKNGSKAPANGAPPHRQEYGTSRGVTVTLSPLPPLAQVAIRGQLEQAWLEAGRVLPAKPTYKVTTAGGGVETHEHDEKSIKDDPEAGAAWQAWLTAASEFELDRRDLVMRSVILDCLEFEISPEWEASLRAKRLKAPADVWERKLFYARTMVLGAVSDYRAIMRIADDLAGDAEQQVDAARESFPGKVEIPAGSPS